jgi:hypothetical protein
MYEDDDLVPACLGGDNASSSRRCDADDMRIYREFVAKFEMSDRSIIKDKEY